MMDVSRLKFHYYPDTDDLYIELSDNPGVDTREVTPGVVMDLDREGKLVGIDIDHASNLVNLSQLEAQGLPNTRFSIQA